jgi:hypothetical protein
MTSPLYTELDKREARIIELKAQNKELAKTLREILEHVEDINVMRQASECTLCHTYRMKGWQALADYEEK